MGRTPDNAGHRYGRGVQGHSTLPAASGRDGDDRPLVARLGHRQLIAMDGLAALVCTLTVQASTVDAAPTAGMPLWVAYVLAARIGFPVTARRRWAVPVLATVLALSVLAVALGVTGLGFLVAALPLYTVAVTLRRPRREPTVAIGAVSAVCVFLLAVSGPVGWSGAPLGVVVLGLAAMGGAWALGRAVREARVQAARAAEQLAREAVTEERLRIARELHDVVSHSMSLIAVKAGIANHVAETRPREARDALHVIESTSRGALNEMRNMLGVLRSDVDADAASGSRTVQRGPVPGLADLPRLAQRAGMAGVAVDMAVDGVDGLPEGVGLSVYRIVQEALTNVVKHAAPARCRVAVEAGAGSGDRRDRRRAGRACASGVAGAYRGARADRGARAGVDARRVVRRGPAAVRRLPRVRPCPVPARRAGHKRGAVTEPIRVIVADDQALVRGSFRMLVDSAAGLAAVGEAGTGAEAIELARETRPDVVLMDVRMPEMDGIEATRHLCGSPDISGVRVLILTCTSVSPP